MLHLAIAIALAAGPASRPAPDLSRVSDLAGYAKGLWNQIEGLKQKVAALEDKIVNLEAALAKQNDAYEELSVKYQAVPAAQRRLVDKAVEQVKSDDAKKKAMGKPPNLSPDDFRLGAKGCPASFGSNHYFTIRQVVGNQDLLIEWGDTPFWVTGQSTSGLIDNAKIEFVGWYEVAGTKTYATALGSSKTVFVLKPVR